MKNIFIKLSSATLLALFCFSDIYPLPLTKTCYTTPQDTIDMNFNEEFIYTDTMNRKDIFVFNLGILSNTSIGLEFSLINYGAFETGENLTGDILFNFWHYCGDIFDGFIDTGFNIVIRIPTGPDAYTDEKCRNLSFGNNELKIGPVFSFNITNSEVVSLNINYIFREGKGEKLYSGININPSKSNTYKSCLGLNPFYKGAFLEGENLKNDYMNISAGIISSMFFPWVFFIELYYSARPYMDRDAIEKINIEGDKVNPFLFSMGIKYFFSKSVFLQVSNTINLLMDEKYPKNITQFGLNLFF